MNFFSRRDTTSILGEWWWTVDRITFFALMLIIIIGIFLSFAASPSVAERLNLGGFYFVKKHILMVIPATIIMIGVSLLTPQQIRYLSLWVYCIGLILVIATFFWGVEIKGAKRWIHIVGFQIQPSEFIKPAFAVLVAWVLSKSYHDETFPGFPMALGLLLGTLFFLLIQPDFGMSLLVVATWMAQIFVAGMPLTWIAFLACGAVFTLIIAYFLLPHVASRIDQFLDPGSLNPHQDLYQIRQSLEAFKQGGIFGCGPGEGHIKRHIPDVHADFVFSVAGEELGMLVCILIVLLFAGIVIRSLSKCLHQQSLFVVWATTGLAIQFGIQSFINLASSLHLIPTKGMTLPFISYGGSSMLALGLGMGMLLGLTRKHHGSLSL
jgi:cell division protein FtsW